VVESPCKACTKPGTLRCSKCKNATYCSADCQKKDWKDHKKACETTYATNTEQTGKEYRITRSKEPGMQQTSSGLVYKSLQKGNGNSHPTRKDSVEVKYRGTLITGTEFDKSESPISFRLDQVISGWTEGLQLMKIGDKFEFIIPHDLAYGTNGSPPEIPPYSTLVFEVELLGIKGKT